MILRKDSSISRIAGPAVLLLGGILSLVQGAHRMRQYGSIDLQWMGANLLRHQIDPWREALNGYPHAYLHLNPPNYLHHLYILLLPLTTLPWNSAQHLWFFLNVLYSCIAVDALRRLFTLDRQQTVILLALLWMSSPMRITLRYGQMGLFELCLVACMYLASTSTTQGLFFGISFAKYSFSPLFAVIHVLHRRFSLLLIALLVPALGLLASAWLLHASPQQVAFEPFHTAQLLNAVHPGQADLTTLLPTLFVPWLSPERAQKMAYLAGLVASTLYAFFLTRLQIGKQAEFALLAMATLFCLKHLLYDFVFLAPVLAYALRSTSTQTKAALAPTILIFWFLMPYLGDLASQYSIALNVVLLGAMLVFSTWAIVHEETLATHS